MRKTTLGSYIRSLRIHNQMTQSQLAEKLNITDKAVSKWERDISYPDVFLFPKLADVLGVSTGDLLRECTEEDRPSRLVQIFEMSHDIRTPLHIILGCADLAETHCDDKESLQRYLRSIRVSGEYLLRSIDRIMRTAGAMQNCADSTEAERNEDLHKRLKDAMIRSVNFAEYNFEGKRILIAEDLEISREIAAELMRRTNAEIEFAEDGRICVNKVIDHPAGWYDLILMDIMMPNMGGIEATKMIRRLPDEKKASVPIIAVSANVYEKEKEEALKAGMNAYEEKPIFADALFAAMKQFLLKTPE